MRVLLKKYVSNRKWKSADGKDRSAWQVEFVVREEDGQLRRIPRGGFANKASAAAFGKEIEQAFGRHEDPLAEPAKEAPTVRAFVQEFLEKGTGGLRPRSVDAARLALTTFLRHVPAGLQLDKLTRRHIDAFVTARLTERPERGRNSTVKKATVSPHTVRRELTVVRQALTRAVSWGLIPSNPTAGVKKPKAPEGSVVFLEDWELEAVLASAGEIDRDAVARTGAESRHNSGIDTPYLRPLLTCAAFTGMRRGELFNLRWSSIDFERNRIQVRNDPKFTTKSGKNRSLDIHPTLKEELLAWVDWFRLEISRVMQRAADTSLSDQAREKAESRLAILRRCEPRPGRLVFPSFRTVTKAGEAAPLDNIDSALERLLEESGLERGRFSLHDLRHTFAVRATRVGVPLVLLQKAMGHASIQTTMIYLRFAEDAGAGVASALPSLRTRRIAAVEPLHETPTQQGAQQGEAPEDWPARIKA